jgi:rhomboid protease GluP
VTVKQPSLTPFITYGILGITVLVFLLQLLSGYLLGGDLPATLGMKANQLIIQGQFWRLITPVFLHGNIMHLALNMYALFIFGPNLERYYGHGRFTALYLLSGFTGNVVSFIASPAYSLGSSTAIFGLLGAEGVFLYQNRKLFPGMAQRALTQLVIVAVINLVIGMSPGIDNSGHIGGLVGGTLFAWFGGPVLKVEHGLGGYTLTDSRESRQVVLAWLGVAILFASLTVWTIWRSGA